VSGKSPAPQSLSDRLAALKSRSAEAEYFPVTGNS
jgi:hypothetical protein